MLDQAQKEALLRLARHVLAEQFGLRTTEPDGLDGLELRQQQGVFVTLTRQGQLRGCIGSITGVESIVDGVRRQTLHAAFHDRRFPLLTKEELPEVRIAISVLTPPQPVAYADGADLVRRLRPQVDGVIIKKGRAAATFLPQVWDELPQPEAFLGQLCRKAGLPAASWRRPGLTVQIYQVVHCAEQE